MNKIFLTLVIAPTSLALAAEPSPRRESEIRLGLEGTTDRYISSTLDAGVALDETWKFTGNYFYSQDKGLVSSREFQFGIDAQLSENLTAFAAIGERIEPNASASALLPGFSYIISNFWKGKRPTSLTVTYNIYSYSQTTTVGQIITVTQKQEYNQNVLGLTLVQELSDSLNAYFALSAYSYSKDPNEIANTLFLRTTSYSGLPGVVSGLPETSIQTGANWGFHSRWSLGLSGSTTSLATNNLSVYTAGFSLTRYLGTSWSIELSGIASHNGGDSNSGIIGLAAALTW